MDIDVFEDKNRNMEVYLNTKPQAASTAKLGVVGETLTASKTALENFDKQRRKCESGGR